MCPRCPELSACCGLAGRRVHSAHHVHLQRASRVGAAPVRSHPGQSRAHPRPRQPRPALLGGCWERSGGAACLEGLSCKIEEGAGRADRPGEPGRAEAASRWRAGASAGVQVNTGLPILKIAWESVVGSLAGGGGTYAATYLVFAINGGSSQPGVLKARRARCPEGTRRVRPGMR